MDLILSGAIDVESDGIRDQPKGLQCPQEVLHGGNPTDENHLQRAIGNLLRR
jgi:hypothetical protein